MKSKDRSWFYIAVLTLVLAIIWATMTAWSKTRQNMVPPDVEKIMTPLNPKLDTIILNKLKNRIP